jgi:hypothetical protein
LTHPEVRVRSERGTELRELDKEGKLCLGNLVAWRRSIRTGALKNR